MHKASQQTMISHKPVGSGRIYSAWQTGKFPVTKLEIPIISIEHIKIPHSFFVMLFIGFLKAKTSDSLFSNMAIAPFSSNTCLLLRISLNMPCLFLLKIKSPELSIFFDLTTEIPAIDSSTRWQMSIIVY